MIGSKRTPLLAGTAVVAVGALLVGCSSSSTSTPTSSAPTTSGPRQIVIIEPDDGAQPVVDVINKAQKTLDFALYEFDPAFTPVVDAAKAAAARGVTVRVILSPTQDSPTNVPAPSKQNQQDIEQFKQLGFQATLADAQSFAWYHQKTIIVDGAEPGGQALIMDFNLTEDYVTTAPNSFDPQESGTRGMAAIDTDPKDVANIQQTFNADFNHEPWDGSNRPKLVWAPAGSAYSPPGNAISVFQNLIKASTKTIDAYIQVFNYETQSLTLPYLLEAAKRGVTIRIVTNQKGFVKEQAYQQLKAAGAQIVMQPAAVNDSSKFIYIHCKTVIFDAGLPNQVAFVGSENPFLDDSLNKERELGVLVDDPGSISKALNTFNRDFSASAPYSTATATPSASKS